MFFSFSPARGQVVYLSLPNSITGNVGDTLAVPIFTSGQDGLGVLSADLTLSYREAVITGTNSCRNGNAVPNGWMVYANPIPDSLLIAMAGADPLVAGDTLVILKFVRQLMDSTTISFARASLNEGAIPCSTVSGTVFIAEAEVLPGAETPGLQVWPNPAHRMVSLALHAGRSISAHSSLDVLDARGRLVRRLVDFHPDATGFTTTWDCRNDQGVKVAAGVYFCRFRTIGSTLQQKLILLE